MVLTASSGGGLITLGRPATQITVVAHGDSITDGTSFGMTASFVPFLATTITANQGYATYIKRGVSQSTWNPGLIADAAASIDPYVAAAAKTWLVLFAGTNGIAGGHSAATEYADFETYLAARLLVPWLPENIVVCMMLPRADVSVESARTSYNDLLVGGASTYGYKLARFDLNAIGAAGAASGPSYIDGVHPTDVGSSILAGIIYGAMYP